MAGFTKTSVRRNRRGFTLIEICIVLFVGGVALTATLDLLQQYRAKQALKINEERISTIHKALAGYLNKNNRLPCAAPRNLAPTSANYGRAADCAVAAAAPATVSVPGVNQTTGAMDALRRVRIGAVPVRDLGLSSAYMGDAWGNQFTYAVTEALTAAPFNPSLAAVDIVKNPTAPTASELTPRGSAFYTVISPGKNGKGAWSVDGRLKSACPVTPLAYEDWNCNETLMAASGARFVSAPFSNSQNMQRFDDQVVYSNTANTLDLPQCAANQVLTSTDGATFSCIDIPVPPTCSASERLTSTDGVTFTCVSVAGAPPACPAGEYLTRQGDTTFTCTSPAAAGIGTPPVLPNCGTTKVLTASGGSLVCKTPVIKTTVRSCNMSTPLSAGSNSYKCTASCPSGYIATGGGMDQRYVRSNKGHSVYVMDGSTGTYSASNNYKCASDAGTCVNGYTAGKPCGMKCFAVCSRIEYQ